MYNTLKLFNLRDEDHKRVVIVRNAICYLIISIDVCILLEV